MIKFTEAVKQYSEEKKARGLSPVVNAGEIERIRKLYKEGKFEENNACPNCGEDPCECEKDAELSESQKKEFEKTLKEFRDYKESKGLGRGVSTKQKKMIERTILAGTMTAPMTIKETKDEKTYVCGPSALNEAQKEEFEKTLKEFRDYKESMGLGRGVSSAQKQKIAESIVKESKKEPAKKLDESVVKELRSKILEARKNVFLAKSKLEENDMMGAADATQAASDAVNAADATIADPAAQGAVPQNIVDTVASLQTTVNDLATQCGIQPPVDVGANPNAGVPAIDGQALAVDSGAAAGAPVMEGLKSTKARLAKREALLNAIKEGAAPANGQDAMVQEINSMTNPQQFHNIDKNNSEELVKPTTQKSKEAANTWPTVKATVKESVTEQMIDKRIKENEDSWDWERILKDGILG